MRRRKRRSERGSTLIETLVASAFVMMAAYALMSSVIYARKSYSLSKGRVSCWSVAQWWTDTLLGTSTTDPRLASGTQTAYFDSYGSLIPTATAAAYAATWTVQLNTPITGVAQITVQVNPTDSSTGPSAKLVTARGM